MRLALFPVIHPVWFILIALAWSSFQSFAGAVAGGFICDSAYAKAGLSISSHRRRWAYVVPHGGLYFLCTLAGFVSWWAIVRLALMVQEWSSVGGGASAAMLALASVAVTGISGALPRILHLGGKP